MGWRAIGERAHGILLHPSGEFPKVRDEPIRRVLLYMVILFAVYLLLALVTRFGYLFFTGALGPFLIFTSTWTFFFALTLFGGIAGFVMMILWLHLWVYLLGGRKGVRQTIKAVLYAWTPAVLLLWIPLPGIASWFLICLVAGWVFCLLIIGIQELHEVSGTVAFKAILISIIGWVVIVILVTSLPVLFAKSVAVTPYGTHNLIAVP